MSRPIVAIVGRPNVGKSTLFNKLAGAKISIVEDTPGVTRDRIYADVDWLKYNFTIIDTGGIEPTTDDKMLAYMRRQAEIAIETANVIVFVVDVKAGLTDADYKVADMLRRAHKPVVLCVNKVDNRDKLQYDVFEFYNLGLGEPYAISASQATGIGDMLDEVVSFFDKSDIEEKDNSIPRIAVIGKPNVGKSSLINKLLGEERVIVSNIAGTTRDSIDTIVKYDGNEYVFVDTAGLRRKNKIDKEGLERYSIIRTVSAIEKADIVVLLIDAVEGVTEQDAKIAGIAHERGKGAIVAVNKWDAIEKNDKTMYRFAENIDTVLSYMTYAPKIYISAKTGLRIKRLFETLDVVIQNHALRVSTGVLNDVLYDAIAMNQPPSDKGKRLKLYYMTQISTKPPTFIIFVNDRQLMHFSYRRYIENRIRDSFGFMGTPIHFIIRERKDKDK